MSEYIPKKFVGVEYVNLKSHLGNNYLMIEMIWRDSHHGWVFEAQGGGYYLLMDYEPCSKEEYDKAKVMEALS